MSRLLVANLIAVLSVGWVTIPPTQAAACTGVTVVVDFGAQEVTKCAPGDPDSGISALTGAGFSLTFVQTQPGFICKINAQPASAGCVRTPPASAYWSYWKKSATGAWVYSTTGAASSNPTPGTTEGWSFGNGKAPNGNTAIIPTKTPTAIATSAKPTPTSTASQDPTTTKPPTPAATSSVTATATTKPKKTLGQPKEIKKSPRPSITVSPEIRLGNGNLTAAAPKNYSWMGITAFAVVVTAFLGYLGWRRRSR